MAKTPSRSASAGASSAFSPDRMAMLHEVHADAALACLALSSVMELLRGCEPTHLITCGGLLALLEPVAGGLESLTGDLNTAINPLTLN